MAALFAIAFGAVAAAASAVAITAYRLFTRKS